MTVASRKLWIFCSLVFWRNSSGLRGIRLTSSIVGGSPQTSGATALTPGIARSFSARFAGSLLKTRRGETFSREDHHPLILVEGITHQVPQAVRNAEKTQDSKNRHRETHQGEKSPERTGHEIEPGEIPHVP